jgi:hypothetical protein
MTTAQIYERLHPDDPIVRAVLAERERCAAIARDKCRKLGGDGYSAGAAAAWQILREITTVTTQRCARDFHFELHFVNDELEDGVLALDEEQVWIEPDRQIVTLSLTEAQLKLLAACPSARARTRT